MSIPVGSRYVGNALLLIIALSSLGASVAGAQQLWSVENVSTRSASPSVSTSVLVGQIAPEIRVASVRVRFDLLRLGAGYLELLLPDGAVLKAENALFEDRDDGNVMWTGEVPGAGYESVLFTVQDGHLVGWFGEPGGSKYVVHAGPDGRGSLTAETEPVGDWCGVEAGPEGALRGLAAPLAADYPVAAGSGSSADRLDILLLYTGGTESYWRLLGGVAVGVRQLTDYLNMVFRNGMIPATAHLLPVRWEPEAANRYGLQGRHFALEPKKPGGWHRAFRISPEVERLREPHAPDLIHFVARIPEGGTVGRATQLDDLEPRVRSGWSLPVPSVFAHEIGHNLGGEHEPATFGDGFPDARRRAFRPYAFGHTDLTSCSPRPGQRGLVCPATIMSYGSDAAALPDRTAVNEPFYSSVRHRPNGWTIGVAGTSEAERVLQETVPVVARAGRASYRAEQYPRRIQARWVDRDTARVTWSGDVPDCCDLITLASDEGANDFRYRWDHDTTEPIAGDDGSRSGLDVSGLKPAGRYRISVLGPERTLADGTVIHALRSEVVNLEPPRRAPGSPTPPDGVGAYVTGPHSMRLHWRDNANNEAGYEVWYREWAREGAAGVWLRYGESLPAGSHSAEIGGLTAEETIEVASALPGTRCCRGRYSFLVVAYNDQGFATSETFHTEFLPGPHAEPTAAGKTTDCRLQVTGLELDGYIVEACIETPDGARRRAWDYRLESARSGLLYFFGRDNVEVLIKVLDACGVNGHRWVFVAPVTDLTFRLMVEEAVPRGQRGRRWFYDSARRPQEELSFAGQGGNPKGQAARTVSDTTAFPCSAAEIAAASATVSDSATGATGSGVRASTVPSDLSGRSPLRAGEATDCEPGGATLALSGGYAVGLCYETSTGEVGDARDWGLDSSQSGLLYFFDRDNVEVLIKVLDGCGVNGHRWVFVAPVTDLAFNLHVESPTGERWTHTNRLGQTADASANTSAFPCA